MKSVQNKWLIATFFLLLVSHGVRAQTTVTAFLPEVDFYSRLSSNVRLSFDAKGYMEDGDLNHAQIGPSLQFTIRPLEKLKQITIFDLDDTKCMPVVFTIGYRYLPSTMQPSVNRLQPSNPRPDSRHRQEPLRSRLVGRHLQLDLSQSHHG